MVHRLHRHLSLFVAALWAVASFPATGQIVVNEWMAQNDSSVADPVDGNFDDWFELFNAGNAAVDLSGYTLSDDPVDPAKYALPTGTVLAAEDHLLIWADEELDQGPLHAGFNLSALGDSIFLYAPDGSVVDSVTFGQQAPDLSEGRWKDGEPAPFYPLGAFTPDAPNVFAVPNTPPAVSNLVGLTVTEGQAFSLAIPASDPDAPPQSLSYFLAVGGPLGLTLDLVSGQLDWTPTEADGPGVYPVTVFVSDDHNTPAITLVTFDITVTESNIPPTIVAIATQMVDEGSVFSLTPTATDPDIPTQTLTWNLGPASPTNATIDSATGLIQWTPVETDGPTQAFEVVVSDGFATDSLRFDVVVNKVNAPPSLSVPGLQAIHQGELFTTTLTASDPDLPIQALSYSLLSGPPGAMINAATGALAWASDLTPPNTFVSFSVQVEDDGSPPLAATNSFFVFVGEPLVAEIDYTVTNDVVRVSWPTLPGGTYTLETTSPSLTNAPNWTVLTQVMATSATAAYEEMLPASVKCRRFYRVRKE